MRFVVVWLMLSQVPPAPVAVTPADGSWAGNVPFVLSAFPADAGTFASARFRVRPDDGGTYGDANAFVSNPLPITQCQPYQVASGFSTQHRAAWCWEGSWANDAGDSAWSNENCFRYDLKGPVPPVLVDGGVSSDGGFITIAFEPTTDDASGVKGYASVWALAPDGYLQDNSFAQFVLGSPVWVRTGIGDIWVGVAAFDNTGQFSTSALVPVTVAQTEMALPTPPPPQMQIQYDPTQIDHLIWSGGAYVSAFRYRALLDAGTPPWVPWITHLGTVGNFGFFLPVEAPLVVETAAIDLQGNVSAWSADSVPAGWDKTAPQTPPGLNAGRSHATGRGVDLSWASSTDVWSGVGDYELQWSVDGGPFEPLAVSIANTWSFDTGTEGTFAFRVRAVDLAGNASAWAPSNTLDFAAAIGPQPDGGQPPDAGPSFDAGSPSDGGPTLDAPEPESYQAGCGCASFEGLGALFAVIALGLLRSRR